MKNFFNLNTIYAGLFLATALLLASCSDDDSFDFPGDSKNRVYLDSSNNYSFSVLHTPVGTTGNIKAKFPVYCNREASTELKVTFATDTALVSVYNIKHSTSYSAVPAGLVVINGNLTITKGTKISTDSLTVTIPENLSKLKESKYLIPVTISTLDNVGNAAISTNMNVVYLVINASTTNCYSAPVMTDMTGTLISDRSSWTASFDVDYYNSTSDLFDGNTGSDVYFNSKKSTLSLDLAKAYTNITGIRIHTWESQYGLTNINVSSSNDGTNWTLQGGAALATGDVYQYIKFYSAISSRYVKLEITGWSSGYVDIAELDVYTNN